MKIIYIGFIISWKIPYPPRHSALSLDVAKEYALQGRNLHRNYIYNGQHENQCGAFFLLLIRFLSLPFGTDQVHG